MPARVAATILVVLWYGAGSGQGSRRAGDSIRATFDRVQSVSAGKNEWQVPAQARGLLTELKHELRDSFTETLASATESSGLELKSRFEQSIRNAGVPLGDPLQPNRVYDADDPVLQRVLAHPYGIVEEVDVQRVQGLVIMTTRLGIVCGSDSSLYVFERTAGGWRRTLEIESNGYKEISGALGSFDWKLGGGSKPGDWFVVEADVNPWCSSNWQQLRWKAVRPGPQPDRPRIISERNETIYLGVDEPYRIEADANGFRIVWSGDNLLNIDELNRERTMGFTVEGTTVTRQHPVTDNAGHFLDEWTRAPWNEAAQWTVEAARPAARTWHSLFARSDAGSLPQIRSVRQCPEPEAWLARVQWDQLDSKRVRRALPENLFFSISGGSQLEVTGIATTRPSGCARRPRRQPRSREP